MPSTMNGGKLATSEAFRPLAQRHAQIVETKLVVPLALAIGV